jgi:pSer/pThr/pTyr-binding forkhead associated (FHA) protein
MVLEGPDPGRCYALTQVNSLGRAADNLVRLKEDTVSAHHALLIFRGGQWWLEDLGSRNGTKVNEVQVEEPLVVTYGDALRLGIVELQLNAGLPQPSPEAQGEHNGRSAED